MRNTVKHWIFCLVILTLLPVQKNCAQNLVLSGGDIYVDASFGIISITDNGTKWTDLPILNIKLPADSYWRILAANGPTIVATSYRYGVFASIDKGVTWKELNKGLPEGELRLTAAVFDKHRIYVVRGYLNSPSEIYYTDDITKVAETGWIKINTFKKVNINTIAINGDEILAGGQKYDPGKALLFIGGKSGSDWNKITEGLEGETFNSMLVTEKGILAGTDWGKGGIFLSEDKGRSWKLKQNGRVISLVSTGSMLFASIYEKGVMGSSDNGQTWVPLNNGFEMKKEVHYEHLPSLLLGSNGNSLYAYSFGILYISKDNGANWIKTKNEKDFRERMKTVEKRIEEVQDSTSKSQWAIEAKKRYDADSTKRRLAVAEEKRLYDADSTNRRERAAVEKMQYIIRDYYCGVAEVLYNNYDTAIVKYTKAINARPHFIEALRGRKNVYLKLNQTDKAMIDSAAITRFKNTDVSNDNIIFKKVFKNYGSTLESYHSDEHLGCFYKDDRSWFESGKKKLDYYKRNQTEKNPPTESLSYAIANFNKAIGFNNKVAKYFIGRGEAYTLQKDFEKAGVDFYSAQKIDPKCQNECYEASFFTCPECKGKGNYWAGEEKIFTTSKPSPSGGLITNGNGQVIGKTQDIVSTHRTGGYQPCKRCLGKTKVQR